MATLKYIPFILLLLFQSIKMFGQDPQFSQLYANPIYMGPSFAGGTGGTRVILSARDQWPAIENEYVSYSFSFDQSFTKARSAIGVVLFNDQAGDGSLKTFKFSMLYSYSLNINEFFNFRPGLQFGVSNRSLDYKRLVLGDQLTIDDVKPTSVDTELNQEKDNLKITYLDFAASALFSHERFWLGMTIDHLTSPNESLLGKSSKIPLKYNYYGGVKFRIKYNPRRSKREDFYLTYQYKHQHNANQAFIGAYWVYRNVITGLWYRGIPVVKTYADYLNNDALIFMAGFRYREMSFSYSYDFTTSRLVANSGGAHEITITWTKIPKKTKKRWFTIPCPSL